MEGGAFGQSEVRLSFRDIVSVRNAGEFNVIGHCGAEIFRSLLNFFSLCASDRFRVVLRSERASRIVAVFLQLVNFSGETGKRGGAPLIFVRV